MHRLIVPLALICACDGGTASDSVTDTDTSDTDTTPEVIPGVMRDCPETVGNICPYAGAGYNGFNGDAVDRLDAWFSFPMSIAFPPTGERPFG